MEKIIGHDINIIYIYIYSPSSLSGYLSIDWNPNGYGWCHDVIHAAAFDFRGHHHVDPRGFESAPDLLEILHLVEFD